MAGPMPRMPAIECPSCGHSSLARSIGKKSPTYRELYYHCRQDRCGHVFVVCMEALRTVRPSMLPSPMHPLPLTTWPGAANDRGVNDDQPPDAPAATAPLTS